MLSYLRVINDPKSDLDVERIINCPKRGIGASTVKKLKNYAKKYHISLMETVFFADTVHIVSAGVTQQLRQFKQLIQYFQNYNNNHNIAELLEVIFTMSTYKESLKKDDSLDDQTRDNRMHNIQELINDASIFVSKHPKHCSLTDYLTELALSTEHTDNESESNKQIGKVYLMTIHSAKGLEFPTVFLPGLVESLLPYYNISGGPSNLEEERRLCYVGITRAKQRLFLSWPNIRQVWGQSTPQKVSRFVAELPTEHITIV